ncbi:MAG: FAD-dependent oxidoreductase, partial [Chloroflexi bacterium]|nr:FAD-dependent oxidoreductase [Chloroflexota bacterium]
TGYVCTHLCQVRCTRNNYDEPVAIRALKRFATERGEVALKPAEKTKYRVAVIGSGPSGLAAAYFLALNGIQVTVYEAKDKAGGMLSIAPAFRLPESVVQADIERIEKLGVKVELSHPITAPPERLLNEGFDAVYIAPGFQRGARLGIEGEEGQGVYQALDFLERASRGERADLGNRILVIGGGNTAMDAARTSIRLTPPLSPPQGGGRVTVVYRRSRREMPATEEEVEELLAEGVLLKELVSPTRIILKEGRVTGLECVRNELGEAGPDGRRKPVSVEGSEFQIEADAIIVAIGQRPDVSFLDRSSISLRKNGTIVVDPQTGLAGADRVYAGGDAVRGPATIVEACADGRRAAEAICHQLGVGFDLPAVQLPVLREEEIVQMKHVRAGKMAQQKGALLPPDQRGGFDLVEATLTEEAALAEAARCMQCSTLCDKCVEVCPNRANYTFAVLPVSLTLPVVSCQEGRLAVSGEQVFTVEQTRQIIHVDDFCNECGNCATFCVHDGKPYLDKPRLFLEESDFKQEDDNAFYVERDERGWSIRRREGGKESRLSVESGVLSLPVLSVAEGSKGSTGGIGFENELLTMAISSDWRVETMELKEEFEGSFSLLGPAEMHVILQAIIRHLSFLPIACTGLKERGVPGQRAERDENR